MIKKLIAMFVACCVSGPLSADSECVILLHGLWRVSNSMGELEAKLNRTGFEVVNINYPSRKFSVDVLAADAVGRGISQCRGHSPDTIHFVTHSLGGILLRFYLQEQNLAELGRVVMLGPPNQGTELVDELSPVPGFNFLWGPSGAVLGTGQNSIIRDLGPVDFDLGIIAGNTNINPLTALLSVGPNDSIVSVESTRVAGMKDHRVLPVTHTFMMRNNEVIDHVIHYLKTGSFIPSG